jgi:wyosine [tRNA(Phe)-imidazoG37] synthetase (radical SAM superfamily)
MSIFDAQIMRGFLMATFLFEDIVFGPVNSRRLGISLGINLVPVNRKVCTFNCIYCECGWTNERHLPSDGYPPRELIAESLQRKLIELRGAGFMPDALTFAGNGEPTLHPDFPLVIGDTIALRDELAPECNVVVLSNASLAHREGIKEALQRTDRNILKLDTGIQETFILLNQPPANISLEDIVKNLKLFDHNLIIQTLFIRGSHNGVVIDNTSEEELAALMVLYDDIRPAEVQVYTIARDTPVSTLSKVPPTELEAIATRIGELGIETSVFP